MTRYQFFQKVFRIIFKLVAKVEVAGMENLPESGPYILAVNHLTLLDAPLVFSLVPRKTNVFAAAKWEHVFFVGWLIRQVDGIFVRRGEVDRRALSIALKILKSGGALGVAPEGTRSRTGGLIRGKPGIVYMASQTNAPIIPIGVSGQLNFHKKLLRLQRLHLRVNIGRPMHLPPVSGANKTQQLQEQVDQVMVALAKLIDPELRGIYADAVEADTLQYLS